MLHPQFPLIFSTSFMVDMGIDYPSFKLSLIDPLRSKFLTGIVWCNVGRRDISVNIEFTTNWVKV